MNKNMIILPFVMLFLLGASAQCQVNLNTSHSRTVSGSVSNIDFVGNTISILTPDQVRMSFYVPGNAVITRDTKDIGLMDIKPGHPVVIKFSLESPGKYSVDTILDNPPGHE